MRGKGPATNLRFKNTGKEALNGLALVTLQCIPALDVKMLLIRVPRPPTRTYVLLTYVLEMPDFPPPQKETTNDGPGMSEL